MTASCLIPALDLCAQVNPSIRPRRPGAPAGSLTVAVLDKPSAWGVAAALIRFPAAVFCQDACSRLMASQELCQDPLFQVWVFSFTLLCMTLHSSSTAPLNHQEVPH